MGCGASAHAHDTLAEEAAARQATRAAEAREERPLARAADDAAQQKIRREHRAQASVLKGNALLSQHKYIEAVREFTRALEVLPGNVRARYERGLAFSRLSRHREALRDVTNVLRVQPDHMGALRARAAALLAVGDAKACVETTTSALKQNPPENECGDLYALRAEAHKALGHTAEALDDMEAAARAEDEAKQCVVCMDEPRGCRLLPCMHAVMCADCAEQLLRDKFACPICGSAIQGLEKGQFIDTFALDRDTPTPFKHAAALAAEAPSPAPSLREGDTAAQMAALGATSRRGGGWATALDTIYQEPSLDDVAAAAYNARETASPDRSASFSPDSGLRDADTLEGTPDAVTAARSSPGDAAGRQPRPSEAGSEEEVTSGPGQGVPPQRMERLGRMRAETTPEIMAL
ncbi:unnamed protein product [Pedinophyceae sp. YPF-701]|nr:unnamed protein product [Pedinophyceae sp. YPF-701]